MADDTHRLEQLYLAQIRDRQSIEHSDKSLMGLLMKANDDCRKAQHLLAVCQKPKELAAKLESQEKELAEKA